MTKIRSIVCIKFRNLQQVENIKEYAKKYTKNANNNHPIAILNAVIDILDRTDYLISTASSYYDIIV